MHLRRTLTKACTLKPGTSDRHLIHGMLQSNSLSVKSSVTSNVTCCDSSVLLPSMLLLQTNTTFIAETDFLLAATPCFLTGWCVLMCWLPDLLWRASRLARCSQSLPLPLLLLLQLLVDNDNDTLSEGNPTNVRKPGPMDLSGRGS